MIPKRYNLKSCIAGDTYNGFQATATLTSSGVTAPIDLTNVDIKMVFKKRGSSTAVSTLEIGTGITLDDAVNGVFSIDDFTAFTPPDTYVYDMEFTYASGVVKTYLKGDFDVIEQIS